MLLPTPILLAAAALDDTFFALLPRFEGCLIPGVYILKLDIPS